MLAILFFICESLRVIHAFLEFKYLPYVYIYITFSVLSSDLWHAARYSMFLFSKQHEELVGIYASQLAGHRCIELFVHMMELRMQSR